MRPVLATCLSLWIAACSSSSLGPDGGLEAGAADGLVGGEGRRTDGRLETAPPPPVSWGACDTSFWPAGYPKPPAEVQCATIAVPLDYAKPGGGTFKLRVARHRSAAFPTGKAVFQLAGGPGGASVWQTGMIPQYMPKLLDSFDLVYVDQRGTGGSGYLDCKAGYPETEQQWVACAAEHADKDLNGYLTAVAAHDIESVRKALGYGKIHVRGGSYGTRLGLELVRQHESSLVAIVLDGLATPDWDYFSDAIKIGDRMMGQLIADCTKDAGCTAVAPDLAADLTALRQGLGEKPRPISIGGKPAVETELDFRVALHQLVNDDYWRPSVPRAVHRAAALGDFALWNALLSDLEGVKVTSATSEPAPHAASAGRRVARRSPRFHRGAPEYVAPGLFIAATCAEDLPNSPGIAALLTLVGQQDWGAGIATSMTDMAQACASWKVSPIDASLRTPVRSAVPALLLSGGVDFITPPEAGDHAAKSLSNSTHLVIPNMTHATMRSSCVGSILGAFLAADGKMASVDTSCIGKLPAPQW